MLISTGFRDEIMNMHDQTGLRGFLDAHDEDVLRVSIAIDSVLSDMDYPEDYRRELVRLDKASP